VTAEAHSRHNLGVLAVSMPALVLAAGVAAFAIFVGLLAFTWASTRLRGRPAAVVFVVITAGTGLVAAVVVYKLARTALTIVGAL
jgi:hypothetical protein